MLARITSPAVVGVVVEEAAPAAQLALLALAPIQPPTEPQVVWLLVVLGVEVMLRLQVTLATAGQAAQLGLVEQGRSALMGTGLQVVAVVALAPLAALDHPEHMPFPTLVEPVALAARV